ncbi:MAG: LCP family protein [Armatimonadota bacterium]
MRGAQTTNRPQATAAPPQRSRWRLAFKITAVLFLLLACAGAGAGLAVLAQFKEQKNPFEVLFDLPNTAFTLMDPRREFPGQDRIVVLCMGLDRNIVRSKNIRHNGMPSTKNARTDVMMVATLDLASQTASILSIPRDTRVILPGKRYHDKINSAHMIGGIPYTREAVEEFLGIKVDYHVVIKQEAIEQVVDALGGVDVNVEGALNGRGERVPMFYEDTWGKLFIDLKPGPQRLTGEQLVGYMRFRKDVEGDFGRIRRQQQAIQCLKAELKSPAVLAKASGLIGAVKKFVKTDLTPSQQMALATLFYKLDTQNMVTAQLPVADTPTIDGISYVVPDEEKTEAMVDWLVRGNQEAMNQLVRVELKNASGDPELYQQMYRILRHQGFQVWRGGRADGEPIARTRAVQRTNLQGAARRVLATLGINGHVEKADERGSDVTIYVGQDLAASPLREVAQNLEDMPDARIRRVAYAGDSRRSRRGRRSSESPVRVRVSESEETSTDEPLEGEETIEAPDAGAVGEGGEAVPPPPDQPGTPSEPCSSPQLDEPSEPSDETQELLER